MPQRTQVFQLLPWTGGINTSLDEAMIPSTQLTSADNLIFDTRGSRKKREGIDSDWDDASSGTDTLIGLHDYWFGSSTRAQRLVGVSSAKDVFSYSSSGTRTTLTVGGTAWSGTLTTCSMATFNNLVIMAVDGPTNVVKYWDGNPVNSVLDLPGSPPSATILRTHLGRLWCNDKSRPDRLHYSQTSDHTQWQGAGDSGALDIGLGDGDPEGITAIFPTFKGDLFVAKRTKLYRVVGQVPEEFQVIKVSDGIGCVSHNSVAAIGNDDVMWVSDKGVHSLQAVSAYGDFSAADVSVDIQKSFNTEMVRGRLKYSWGAYLDTINSYALAVTETSALNRSLTSTSVNNAVYLYNIPLKAWFRWPDRPCSALIVANDADRKRFYFGTHTTRVTKSFTGNNYDVAEDGSHTAIKMRVATGQISLDETPYTMKALKRFGLVYRPKGTHNISVIIKIDNISINPENSLGFSETGSSDLLGSTFILGSSTLGFDAVLGAYTRTIDGVGRTVKVIIEQNDTDAEAEIQGWFLEWEPAGTSAEVFLR